MCDVTTALMVGSLIFSVGSGVVAADSAKAEGNYRQQVANQNAELDDIRATQAATAGAMQEEAHRAKVRQMAGAQRADFAARGIDLQSGIVQDLQDETYTFGETDALMIRYNAMNEAWGYRTSATNERNAGRFARWSGNRQAMGTYLTTAANATGTLAGAYGRGGGTMRSTPRGSASVGSGAASFGAGFGRGFGG